MQTPAERHMVQTLIYLLNSQDSKSNAPPILNAGAGKSIAIERQLSEADSVYKCDRIDIDDCHVDFPSVGNSWQCSIENMSLLRSDQYLAVFSNYVLEHVHDTGAAASEIYRVLAPGGLFIATIPNVSAIEFVLSSHTPLWFHKLVRQKESWETVYAYDSVADLLDKFVGYGFIVLEDARWPFVEGYLGKYPVIGQIGKIYDKAIAKGNLRKYMGDVCISLQKPI